MSAPSPPFRSHHITPYATQEHLECIMSKNPPPKQTIHFDPVQADPNTEHFETNSSSIYALTRLLYIEISPYQRTEDCMQQQKVMRTVGGSWRFPPSLPIYLSHFTNFNCSGNRMRQFKHLPRVAHWNRRSFASRLGTTRLLVQLRISVCPREPI